MDTASDLSPEEMRAYEEGNEAPASMKWHYYAVSQSKRHTELGEYHTYGIGTGSPDAMKIVHDISTSEKKVSEMATLFTAKQLSPMHLKDVVEDMLP